MRVGIKITWNDNPPFQVINLRFLSDRRVIRSVLNIGDTIPGNRHILRENLTGEDVQDPSVDEDLVRRCLPQRHAHAPLITGKPLGIPSIQ